MESHSANPMAISPESRGIYIAEDEIRLRAYQLYERNGFREGHAAEDWLEAEQQISQNLTSAA